MKKVIFSVLAICLVAGVAGIGTWAYFSDIETSPGNFFEAGTLDLVVNDENPLTSTLIEIENVAPGDAGVVTVVGENIGSIDGTAFIHLRMTCNEDNGIWEPEDMVDGVLDGSDGTAKGDLPSNLHVTITAGGTVIADGLFKDIRCHKLPLGDLPAGASMEVTISWEIPGWVGNIIQSDRLCFDIDFILEQKAEKAEFTIHDLVQPSVAVECDDVEISVQVTNTGTAVGTVTVSVDIDGIHLERTVAVEAGATATVDFSEHLAAGSYDVVASIPGQSLDPCHIDVIAPGEVELSWEETPADTIYVCDNVGWVVRGHNIGDVSVTADVTLTVTVGDTEKYTATQPGVTFDPCDPVVLSFGPWHAEDDPHQYSGEAVVYLDAAPRLSDSFTLIDMEPTAAITEPPPGTAVAAGDPLPLTVHCTDDVMVIGAGYTIDDPMATPELLSGTPGPEGDWTATIDTTGLSPGTHTIYAGCMDSVGQQGIAVPVDFTIAGAAWEFSNLNIPDTGLVCEDIPVSVDLHNSGTVSGSYSVTLTVDGEEYTLSGSLDPCDSVALEWTLHFTDPGVYMVQVDGLPVELVTITEPVPPTLTPGDTWIFDTKYEFQRCCPRRTEWTEDDTQTVVMNAIVSAGTEVGGYAAGRTYALPEDCYELDATFVNDAGGDVRRKTELGRVTLDPSIPVRTWIAQDTHDEVYRESYMLRDAGYLAALYWWDYYDTVTGLPTDDHGWPYDVGTEWGVHTWVDGWIGPPNTLMFTFESYSVIEVEGEVVITVPAGAFSVKHVVTYESDPSWTKGDVCNEMWYCEDPVKYHVKYIDCTTYYSSKQTDELESYIIAP